MPCESSYMESGRIEKYYSRVLCLLEELRTGVPVDPKSDDWDGYHPQVYNKTISEAQEDKWVATLCSKLKTVDVTKYSLEMQLWWRDHQRADAKREERKREEKHLAKIRRSALAKLSKEERRALGIKSADL